MTATSCAMPSRIAAGTPAFNSINRAMLLGGFATFALLYCVQPMMPLLAQEFALTAAQSSWALSISTLTLAFTLLICSALSERVGRKPMMVIALTTAALATIACAFVSDSPGAIAPLYLLGMVGSVLAGKLVDRIGRRSVLLVVVSCMLAGLLQTLSQSLLVIVAGTALFTFGFFASHSVASSWVASRALAQKALAGLIPVQLLPGLKPSGHRKGN